MGLLELKNRAFTWLLGSLSLFLRLFLASLHLFSHLLALCFVPLPAPRSVLPHAAMHPKNQLGDLMSSERSFQKLMSGAECLLQGHFEALEV